MADTAKKAESDKTEGTAIGVPDSKTAEALTSDYGRESTQSDRAEVHVFTFDDGTSAKVWQAKGDTHLSVQLRNQAGRGTSATTTDGHTVAAVNKIIDEAGQKAKARAVTEDKKK